MQDQRNWKLIEKLLTDGNIDEEYSRYISYFHEGELTRNDYDFITKIKDGDSLDFTYNIDNIKVVINELSVSDFKNNIENFAVAEYMFKNSKIDDKRKYYINNFFENSDDEFIKELLEKNLQNKNLISSILKEAGNRIRLNKLFNILKDNGINALLVILINNLKDIKLLTTDKDECNILLSSSSFDIYEKIEDKKVFENYLLSEQIIFNELSTLNYKQSKKLFNFIYDNSFYKLTYENTKSILINLFNFKESEEIKLKTANLTTIKERGAENLINNIDENINLYFDEYFNKMEESIKESEEVLLYLLNHKELKEEHKKEIITLSENKITTVINIEDKDLWAVLFQENKVEAYWDNLLHYYNHKDELDDIFIAFLNQSDNYKELAKFKINNEAAFGKELLQKFSRLLLKENKLTDEAYGYLIKSIFWKFADLNMDLLSSEKIEIILNHKKISLNSTTLNSLKKNCPEKQITLIESFKDEFLEKYKELSLDANNYIQILKTDKFTDDEKISIIKTIDFTLLESEELVHKIIAFYINVDDKISEDLFDKLFETSDRDNALKILTKQIPELDEDKISSYLNQFEGKYAELTEISGSPLKMPNNVINQNLVIALELKRYIPSKDILDKEIKVNRKRKRK